MELYKRVPCKDRRRNQGRQAQAKWKRDSFSTDATGPHHQENPSNKPNLLMLVLWSTSG